jgi:hypothetical protein
MIGYNLEAPSHDFSSQLLKSECSRCLPSEPQKSFDILVTHDNIADSET